MNAREREAIRHVIATIDAGEAPPQQVSGYAGRFVREYAKRRDLTVRLAADSGAKFMPGMGMIRGLARGPVSLYPIDRVFEWEAVDTRHGSYYHVPCLCPELLTLVNLRLWTTSGSGLEAIERFKTRGDPTAGVRVDGAYRWAPPTLLQPGTARLDDLPSDDDQTWWNAGYLKWSAEDIGLPVDPLEYIELVATPEKTNVPYAALRVVAGIPDGLTRLIVPRVLRVGFLDLDCTVVALSPSALRTWRHAELVITLLLREPTDERWKVVGARAATTAEVVAHGRQWAEHLRALGLTHQFPNGSTAGQTVSQSLRSLGVAVPTGEDRTLSPPAIQSDPLAREITIHIRLQHLSQG